jgi:hypothetical protein
MAGRRRNRYREATPSGDDAHPVDVEVDRRIPRTPPRRQIIEAQQLVLDALGEQRHLYLRLEELVGRRHSDREEAMFDVGFEHGQVQGRADALAASLQQRGARGRALATQTARLVMSAGVEPTLVLAALLEVAWSLALGPKHRAPCRARPKASPVERG